MRRRSFLGGVLLTIGVGFLIAATWPSPHYSSVQLDNALNLGNWTTSTRPSSPTTGALGWNTTLSAPDFWSGSAWVNPCVGSSCGGSGSTPSLGSGLMTDPNGNITLTQGQFGTAPQQMTRFFVGGQTINGGWRGLLLESNDTSAVTYTFAPSTWYMGDWVKVMQGNTGQITFSACTNWNGLTHTAGQGAVVTAYYDVLNSRVICTGDMS